MNPFQRLQDMHDEAQGKLESCEYDSAIKICTEALETLAKHEIVDECAHQIGELKHLAEERKRQDHECRMCCLHGAQAVKKHEFEVAIERFMHASDRAAEALGTSGDDDDPDSMPWWSTRPLERSPHSRYPQAM